MKTFLSCSMVMAFLCLAGAQHVAAQENGGGGGGFWDWIHRLSGPQMGGPALSYFSPYKHSATERPIVRGRLTVAHRFSIDSDDRIDPDGSKITMNSIQAVAEFPITGLPLIGYVELGGGFALHRFGGDSDGFWHWSVPIFAQRGLPLSRLVELKLNVGGQYFPKFEATDFEPLMVMVERNKGELVLAASLGVDLHLFGNE